MAGLYVAGTGSFALEASPLGVAGDWFRGERMLRAGVRIELVDRVAYEYYPSALWEPAG